MMARADRLIREAEGRYERSKAHELQGKGNATGKLVEASCRTTPPSGKL